MVVAADNMQVPVVDFSQLQNDSHSKSLVIKQIGEACGSFGVFHVINHGISETLIQQAMDVNSSFFGLPLRNKDRFISDDIYKPVRYSPNQGGNLGFSREFLKLYAHPFDVFVSSWPDNPPDYREKMGRLSMEMKKLGVEILEFIMESLNLEATYLKSNIEEGMHIVAINSYPPISTESEMKKIGVVPHTDHSIITILLQTSAGLQVMDQKTGKYESAFSEHKGSIQILVGEHLEVLSNGKYKAVRHQVEQMSRDETRLSVASFLSLGMDEVIEPAVELVDDEERPKRYKGSSLRDFLKHLASGESKPFIETIRI
ncbi:OLC1v1031656C1 [Oldenlandia corymbosa var. corymbosa]|uniref:OLC1v1031656C1 n=1 Tax=Oldenlandia corymbosa var. corymbosa TaxID=529605 RepID=A0AAV1CJU4_OLDCO|nr:OLC1v1031656C1 [Oldenlandia corymbosa var. corymbosa]